MGINRHLLLTGFLSMQAQAAPPWTPVGLTQELYPIARLESSWGKYVNHEPHSKGKWYSAHGALGLKAVTGYEAMLRSRNFMMKWSNGQDDLCDRETFLTLFLTNNKFYNELATLHWKYLRRNTASVEQAVYAWRWGLGAATATTTYPEDKYVVAYMTR